MTCTTNSFCRNILGEDLGPLSLKELEQLENQIETSLKHIRSREVENLIARFIFFYSTLFSLAFDKC
jgi:hypothetical protein